MQSLVIKIFQTLNIAQRNLSQLFKKWKEYGTAVTVPNRVHPPKLSGQVRRKLVREAAKKSRVVLNMMLPAACFHIDWLYIGSARTNE